MKKSLRVVATLLTCSTAALAAAPGPIDGLNIPSNYANSAELAVQTNNTGFGNQIVNTGAFTPGSEVDGLYLAKDANYLYVGVSGNLERNGHAFVIFVDVDDNFGLLGQSELRAEGVGGPPHAVQTASREVIVDTNGTQATTDDTWMYGANGTTLPCAPDYAIAVDVFGGTMSISEYALFDPVNVGPVGSIDPTPDNPNDPAQDLYASREFIGQSAIDDGNDVIENLQPGNAYGPGGFDDTNTSGVTDTDATNADAATTGLELGIPLSRFLGADDIELFVVVVDGGDSTGLFVPQALPAVLDADACTSGAAFPLRADLSSALFCLPVDIAALPTFSGSADGDIEAAEYGAAGPVESQDCPTPYGDQEFDPDAANPSGGSELDALYVDNDENALYIGITGNLEKNGNQLMLFIDTDPDGADLGTNGREPNGSGGFVGIISPGAPGGSAFTGLNGDALPEDLTSNAVNFNFGYQMNASGGGPNLYVDQYNYENKSFQYKGAAQIDSGSGTLSGGTNPLGIQVAYNSLNNDGVDGNCFDAGSCLFMTTNGSGSPAQVDALARSATRGFEIKLPWSALNVSTNSLPSRVHVWAFVTGNSGYGSNQTLPPLRPRSNNAFDTEGAPIKHMVGNAANGPNDYSDGRGSAPDRQFDSWAAEYEVEIGVLCHAADVNCDGNVTALDIAVIVNPANWLTAQGAAACDRSNVNGTGGTTALDIAILVSPVNWLQIKTPGGAAGCICVSSTPGPCPNVP